MTVMKRRLTLAATIAYLAAAAITHPIYAQQAPELPRKQPPGEVECQKKLDQALMAIEQQKKLIAALETRLRGLQAELADCKKKMGEQEVSDP